LNGIPPGELTPFGMTALLLVERLYDLY